MFHGVCMGEWEKQDIGTVVLPCVGLFAAAQLTLCAITSCDALLLCGSLEQVTHHSMLLKLPWSW